MLLDAQVEMAARAAYIIRITRPDLTAATDFLWVLNDAHPAIQLLIQGCQLAQYSFGSDLGRREIS